MDGGGGNGTNQGSLSLVDNGLGSKEWFCIEFTNIEIPGSYSDLKIQGGANGKSPDVVMQGSSPQAPYEQSRKRLEIVESNGKGTLVLSSHTGYVYQTLWNPCKRLLVSA